MAAVSLRQSGPLMASDARSKKREARARQLPGVGSDVEASLLDIVDNVLNKGMVLNGDLVLGVANVDLIYARLSVLLAALDKIGGAPLFSGVDPKKRRRAVREGKLHSRSHAQRPDSAKARVGSSRSSAGRRSSRNTDR